jgi:hypothetical protein
VPVRGNRSIVDLEYIITQAKRRWRKVIVSFSGRVITRLVIMPSNIQIRRGRSAPFNVLAHIGFIRKVSVDIAPIRLGFVANRSGTTTPGPI